MNKNVKIILPTVLVLLSFFMHAPHFSKDLMSIHVWRQTQTQGTIQSFYEEDMNILNPKRYERGNTDGNFRMEFPLMQWSVAVLYKVFGPHIAITRLFMWLCAMLAAWGMFRLFFAIFNAWWSALAGAVLLTFSPAFYYHGINPMPDNLALCLSIWGMAYFFGYLRNPAASKLALSGFFLALGVMCKLPFVVWYAAPGIWLLWQLRKQKPDAQWLQRGLFLFLPMLMPVVWYAWVMPHWNSHVIVEGIVGNWESLGRTFNYMIHNAVSTLPELLLNYAAVPLFLLGIWIFFTQRHWRHPFFVPLFMWLLVTLAYYIYEANAIGKDHDYYLYPFYPLIFLPVAMAVHRAALPTQKRLKYLTLFLLLLLPLTCYLRLRERWNPEDPGFNRDLLVHKEALRQAVPDDALVVAGNDVSRFIFFYYIHKKGWGFDGDGLHGDSLRNMVKSGARYLFSDSRKIEADTIVRKQIHTMVGEYGSIRVYSLKP
jgi:4-amino-4-deoxy-L-arabinose transferase-like glycosyltransferase